MAIVRPDWRVEAPPVVILALAAVVAPPSGAAKEGWAKERTEARQNAAESVPA